MAADAPNVCLTLSNQPENVLLVRETLSGLADTVGVDGVELNDIRTAVTEACNNVVLHAYDGAEGPMRVELYLAADAVEVVVRDHGKGIKPHIRGEQEDALGIGMSIIQALAPRVEFKDVAGGGTEVRMEFATPNASQLERITSAGFEPPMVTSDELATTSGVALAPSALAGKVLPRVVCVLAARAHFTTDRISDAEIVADALVSQSFESSTSEHMNVVLAVNSRELELRVGPLRGGSAEQVVAHADGNAVPIIEKLTDDRRVAIDGSSETLELLLRDNR
jgi:anti-sigma regulatory factor (Ser/Thr protein kinase)